MTAVWIRTSLRITGLVLHVLLGNVLALLLLMAGRRTGRMMLLRARNSVVRWWLRTLGRLLGVRVTVYGERVVQPALFVANHMSWLDIIALSEVISADFVAKQEVRAWPLFGWLASMGGTLFVRRGDFGAARAMQGRMEHRLAAGRSLILFPEGTTSAAAVPKPFKPRLFQAAIHAEACVQPVAISYHGSAAVRSRIAFVGDQALLHNLWLLLGMPTISLTIRFMPPIASAGVPARKLADGARESVCQGLENPPGFPDVKAA